MNVSATYDISFIAFVHPQVQTSRKGLTQLGDKQMYITN